jgi:MFS family permease
VRSIKNVKKWVDAMNERRHGIFYGWWVILTAAFGLMLGTAPIIAYSFGVFIKPLSLSFHTGRAAISLAFTLHNLVGAFSIAATGKLIDRYGARRVIVPFTVTFGVLLLCAEAVSGKLWQLYLFYLALGVVSCGTGPVPYSDVVSHWFDRWRGLALGLMMLGLGVGAIVMPPLAGRLIVTFGWRPAYAVFGAAVLIIAVPLVLAFLKETPDEMGLLPDGTTQVEAQPPRAGGEDGMSWHDASRSRTFWVMLSAFTLVSLSVGACLIHMAAILSDRGSNAGTASLASSLLGLALLIGRVTSGFLLDRLFGPHVAASFFGCAAAGIALLWATRAPQFAFAAAFLIGLGLGAEIDIMGYLAGRYFGLRSFGEIYGYMVASFAAAGGLGAYLMGAGFDLTGSYALPLAAFLLATIVSMLLMTRLGPYGYRVRIPGGTGVSGGRS